MGAVIAALTKAFAQLGDRAVLSVLVKSLLVTLAIFAVLGTGLWFAIEWSVERWIAPYNGADYTNTITAGITVVITVLAGWLLFRVVALAVLQFFADEIVRAVERRHYPEAANTGRDLPFREDLSNSMRGLVRALGFNLLALPVALLLLFTAIGPAVVFLTVNAVLLGRELTDMAWLRHRQPDDIGTPVRPLQRLALGGVIAGLMLVPFVNLLAPILGAAAGTHLTHLARAGSTKPTGTADA